jgi:cell fate (sporulation/competence/biofilm development) regulator YlbF (YheA/YmcA/DUF963 family)
MIEEKAKELGRVIGQSTEYQALKRANDALGADTDAVGHLQQMERLRADVQRNMERGQRPTEEQERQLDDLLGKIQGNPTYQRFVAAQENLDKLMARVNDWMVEGMEKGATSKIITLS